MLFDELHGMRAGLGIDDIVDVALAPEVVECSVGARCDCARHWCISVAAGWAEFLIDVVCRRVPAAPT